MKPLTMKGEKGEAKDKDKLIILQGKPLRLWVIYLKHKELI